MCFPEWNLDLIKHLHSFQLLMMKFLQLILPVTCAMAWRCVHMNAVLLIGIFLELEMQLGRSCWLPLLFVSYFLKLDRKFLRVREEVNLHPAEAYANFGSLYSDFAVVVLLSLKIRVRVISLLCFSCSFLMHLPEAFRVYLKLITPFLFVSGYHGSCDGGMCIWKEEEDTFPIKCSFLWFCGLQVCFSWIFHFFLYLSSINAVYVFVTGSN